MSRFNGLLVAAMAAIFSLVMARNVLSETTAGQKPREGGKSAKPDLVKRGEYLVNLGGCNHCHTPWIFDKERGAPHPDMTRMLMGHPENAPDPAGKYTAPDMAVIGPDFTSFNQIGRAHV